MLAHATLAFGSRGAVENGPLGRPDRHRRYERRFGSLVGGLWPAGNVSRARARFRKRADTGAGKDVLGGVMVLEQSGTGLTTVPPGLTAAEATRRSAQYGPNEVAESKQHPVGAFLRHLWAPVPWMLEATVALQLVLGKTDEAVIIAALLFFNAALSFSQEGHANKALALLRKRLNVQARVRREGRWQLVPARELVPGDVIHLRMGDLVPADVALLDGQVQLDQSTLTGESLPVDAGSGAVAYSGSIVRRGEATGEVTATGTRTRFGKTAELVRTAKTASHLESLIFTIVKYLIALDLFLVAGLLADALATGMSLADVIPFALVLLVASVPVALPATFTLATALGALELSKRGVLVTRLSAVEEAAAMDTLASDKTGTVTENRLTLAALKAFPPFGPDELLRLAALACDEATQDPIDLAILSAARERSLLAGLPPRLHFVPFDPSTRRSEAVFERDGGPGASSRERHRRSSLWSAPLLRRVPRFSSLRPTDIVFSQLPPVTTALSSSLG